MAYFDIKVSVWQRIEIPEEVDPQTVIEYFRQHTGTGNIYEIGIDSSTYETIHDSEEELQPEDNEGDSTVEVYDDNKQLIWNNKPQ